MISRGNPNANADDDENAKCRIYSFRSYEIVMMLRPRYVDVAFAGSVATAGTGV